MKKLLLESIDNESRKAAITFLQNNFKRCFTLDKQDLPDNEKQKLCQEYVKTVEINYCIPWDAGGCNWTKALIMALVRILKTECNDGTSRPVNTRMKAQLKKVAFAAMMYRQKQVWDGVPKDNIMSKDADGKNFYQLSALVMPQYDELMSIYLNGYGDVWAGKEAQAEVAARKRAEKDAANNQRFQELLAKVENGGELNAEEKAFVERMKAKQAQQNAPAPAVEQPVEEPDPEVIDDPWAEDNGFTDEHPRPYMKGRFRIGTTGYWAVRIDQYEQSKTWWWWTYPNCPYPTQIDHTWCITNPNSRNFFYYGIGTTVTAYYVFKEGFEKLKRPSVSENAPYDEWGKSLICIMIDRYFNDTKSTVHVCSSRYNQAQPNNQHGYGNGYGNSYMGQSVQRLAELFGCSKQEIYDKFVYKLANEVGQDRQAPNAQETKKILNDINQCKTPDVDEFRLYSPAGMGVDLDAGYKVSTDGYSTFYYRGTFVTPWVKSLLIISTKQNMYLYYTVNDQTYIVNTAGKPLFSESLKGKWDITPSNDNKYLIFRNRGNNKSLVFDCAKNKWLGSVYIEGVIDTFTYPFVSTNDGNIYEYIPRQNKFVDAKPKLNDFANRRIDGLGMLNIINSSFIQYQRGGNIFVRRTGEEKNIGFNGIVNNNIAFNVADRKVLFNNGNLVDFSEEFDKLSDEGYIRSSIYYPQQPVAKPYAMYFAYKNNINKFHIHLITSEGETVKKTIDYPDMYYNEFRMLTDKSYLAIFTKPGGESIAHLINIVNGKEIEIVKTFKTYDLKRYTINDKTYIVYKINGQRAEVYDSDTGKMIFSVPRNMHMATKITNLKVSSDGILIRVGLNNNDYLAWANTNVLIPATSRQTICMGNGYAYVKTGDKAKVYDDRGTVVFDGKFNFGSCFNGGGIASVVNDEGKTVYFNLDNEYSEKLEDIVESKRLKKRPKTNYILEAAAYFC